MFADPPPRVTQPSTSATLRNAKTVIINNEDHDVFGDGTIVIKWAPGHTQGHAPDAIRNWFRVIAGKCQ